MQQDIILRINQWFPCFSLAFYCCLIPLSQKGLLCPIVIISQGQNLEQKLGESFDFQYLRDFARENRGKENLMSQKKASCWKIHQSPRKPSNSARPGEAGQQNGC